jgi:hypothetical protein
VPLDVIGLVLLVAVRRHDAGHDRQGQGARLVQLGPDRHARVVSVVSFMFFLAWELTDKHPIVDLRLFARRNFLMGTLALSVGYGLFFGNVVLLPLWLQQYMGYTATWAGMALRAGRRARDRAVAVGRQERQPDRSAPARRPSPSSASRWCSGCARASTCRPTS